MANLSLYLTKYTDITKQNLKDKFYHNYFMTRIKFYFIPFTIKNENNDV